MVITDKIWKQLLPAINYGEEFVTRNDLEEGIKKGKYKLFKNNDSSAITANSNKTITIGLAGGKLPSLIKIAEKVENYAKNRHYDNIKIIGRSGWEKVLNGYKKKKEILKKEI